MGITNRFWIVACLGLFATHLAAAGDIWPKELGSHRAVVRVDHYAPAVWVHIPWREATLKGITIVDAATRKAVQNVANIDVNCESGDLAFEPVTGPGDYYVYYRVPYPETPKVNRQWIEKNNLTEDGIHGGTWQQLTQAQFVKCEASNLFEAFTSMEEIATREETEQLLANNSDTPYLVFPTDRKTPIRLTDNLTIQWAQDGPSDSFTGVANRGEFYTFQLGVYAARMDLMDLDVQFDDLKPQSDSGQSIPASAMHCFNKEGVDWEGRHFTKVLHTDKGKIRPLWIGVQIPKNAEPGFYNGSATIVIKGAPSKKIALRLLVDNQVLQDSGDADLWRYSRLRWLDSTIGLDDEPCNPFTPVTVQGQTVSLLGRDLTVGNDGLPAQIQSHFSPDNMKVLDSSKPLLAAPVTLVVEDENGKAQPFSGGTVKFTKQTHAKAAWQSQSSSGDLSLYCEGSLEFDGYMEYDLAVTAKKTTSVKDIHLEIRMPRNAVPYMMGLGVKGGFRQPQVQWKWDPQKLQDSIWLGDVNGGVRWQFLDDNYERPLVGETFKPLAMPVSWQNGGLGGVAISEEASEQVLLNAFSGARTIQEGETLHFNLSVLLTPFKTLDMATHWGSRYYQEAAKYPTPDDAESRGVNVVNLHQGNDLNPYINYPFLTVDALKKYVQEMHARGIKTKIYYTIRELSTHVAEMWPLRSLDGEIFVSGASGTGQDWMQDHLIDGYVPAWTAVLPDGELDTSVLMTALSRWDNYYLEGLNWLMRNVKIDGLYLDGIGYDRCVMQRARKIMDRDRPGSLIDWHEGNTFQPRYGLASPADLYMEFFPYINRTWFGEMFDYGETPQYYLIEISGIPFGCMGEMINGNPWRGPVYGMASRMGWAWGMNDPRATWKVWDAFGIADSRMIGYWVPGCPVKADLPEVRATVYSKPDKVLIAMASWLDKPVQCTLSIDWNALGLDGGQKWRLHSPVIDGVQTEAVYSTTDPIPIDANQGRQLILERAQ